MRHTKGGKIILLKERSTPLWEKILKRSGEIQIKVDRRQGTLLRIPLILGIFGTAVFPRLVSLGTLGLLLARCTLEMERR